MVAAQVWRRPWGSQRGLGFGLQGQCNLPMEPQAQGDQTTGPTSLGSAFILAVLPS